VIAANRVAGAIAKSPIFWGILASVAFFTPFEAGWIHSRFQQRYFAGHPVEYTETVLFFVGLAFLIIRALEIVAQYRGLSAAQLPSVHSGGQPLSDCEGLLARLERGAGRRRNQYFFRRLCDGLDYVGRRGSTDGLDDQLKYLSDQDSARMHADYGLMRLVVWAIPILGFLGTVIGITIAIANLAPDALEKSLPEVTAGLGVAFDTTALALGLSIVLMFIQHYVDRAENGLLAEVDRRAEAELIGRFQGPPVGPDSQTAAVRIMGEQFVRATEQLVERQAAIWRGSIEAAGERWTRMADAAGRHLQLALSASLAESLKTHACQLSQAEEASAEKSRAHWNEMQAALVQACEALRSVQEKLVEKTEVLQRAVDATGQVARLEETLNRNLSDLAGTKSFEQMLMSLSAAISLLNARLAALPAGAAVQLEPRRRTGQAA